MIFLGATFAAGVALFVASVIMGQELDATCGTPKLRKYNTAISTIGAVLASVSMAFLIAERKAPPNSSPHTLVWQMLITVLCVAIMILAILVRGEVYGACSKVVNVSNILTWVSGSAALLSLGTIGYSCSKKVTPVAG